MKKKSQKVIKRVNKKALIKQFASMYKGRGFFFLLVYLVHAVNDTFIKKYIKGSFSQKGEDLVIDKILGFRKKGFYIDVGAHNPNVFNNTKRFYIKGWSGINIEPNPVLFKEFIRQRRRDINLNIGVKNTSGKAIFYEFESDGLSTFSKKEAESNINLGYKLKQELKISVISLNRIFEKYCKAKKIDFISIDTEGLDFEVLQSNNWNKFRPKVVCIETGDFNSMITGEKSGKKKLIESFMIKNNYQQKYDNGLNTIYVSDEYMNNNL